MYLKQDLQQALYNLAKVKGYSLTIIFTLAITLGTFIAMLSLNVQLLIKPLPYPDAEQLVLVRGDRYDAQQKRYNNWLPYQGIVEAYEQFQQGVENKALHNISIDVEQSLPSNPTFNTGAVTPEFLTMINAPLHLGRHMNNDEGLHQNVPVSILSYKVWQQFFNSDPNVIDKTLMFKGVTFQIIGVLARDFQEPVLATPGWYTDVWISYDFNDARAPTWDFSSGQAHLVMKLTDTASRNETQLALESWLTPRLREQLHNNQAFKDNYLKVHLISYYDRIIGKSKQTSLMMFLGSAVLLLIALSNIGNLVISRAVNRQRTMAIHVSLGAQPFDLFKQIFIELLCLFVAAAILSLGMVTAIFYLLKSGSLGQLPRLGELHISPLTVIFVAMAALLLNLLLALWISRLLNYRALNQVLQHSGKGTGAQVSQRTRSFFITLQVTLCVCLLTICSTLLQSSWKILTQPSGLKHDNTYQVALNLGDLLNIPKSERLVLLHTLLDTLRAKPTVKEVGIGGYPPISYWVDGFEANLIKQGPEEDATSYKVLSNIGTEEYFKTLGLTLVSGRFFNAQEVNDDSRVLVISRQLARQMRQDEQVLGDQLFSPSDDTGHTIIGIVEDLNLPHVDDVGRVYFPAIPTGYPFILIEMQPGQQLDRTKLNTWMSKVHNQIKVYNFNTTDGIFAAHTKHDRTTSGLSVALSLIATSLAFIGIYGVLVYNVAVRRTELGIRQSLGATPIRILSLVLVDNLKPVFVGVLLALTALISGQFLLGNSSFAFTIEWFHYALPTLAILLLVFIASYFSLRRVINSPAIYALKDA
ncbi:ABC transporter permease [Pseudoalteromonas sp. T1lg65]|uniref:ABC transporter permease n=1 Tax=Pseudoalteromonas sp. T1lg65 TaxID=2077101 RepID=UPI003F79855A